MIVTDFLSKHFDQIMDYHFTAKVEKEFDEIAQGQLEWNKMIEQFYKPFHSEVEKTTEHAERQSGERVLGVDPVSGKNVYAKVGRFGPFVQLGEGTEEEKPQYAKLRSGLLIETITLDEAMELFKLPRVVGEFEGKEIKASLGRFGPYLLHDGKFISIPKPDDAYTVDEAKAIELIENKRITEANRIVKLFAEDEDLKVLNGRWGAYIAYGKDNYKIPKGTEASSLTYDEVMTIIGADKKSASSKTSGAKSTAAKGAKTAPKKAKTAAKKSTKTAAKKSPKK